jgi:hypothetical protein
MADRTVRVRFHHPLDGTVLELALPASATFGEILKLLYQNGFLEKKAADYGFIMGQRLCARNKSLKSYVPPETSAVDVEISGLLTILA